MTTVSAPEPPDLPWWAPPSLTRVWGRVAERLERGGLRPEGRVVVDGLDRAERHALGGLLGRVVTSSRCTVDLASLDRRLRTRSGTGLVQAAEAALGRALVDRPSARQARRVAREEPYVVARDWLREHPGLDRPWVHAWLEALRRDGLPSRHDNPTALVRQALEVLAACTERGTVRSRTELAAGILGDAHALDEGRRLEHVVVRALAAREDRPTPATAAERRDLWAQVGVSTDTVSSTCLCLRLGATGSGGLVQRLQLAAAAGDPVHLTWWDLEQGLRFARGQEVLVCENPRVLEAFAQQGPTAAVVCTSGRSSLVTRAVLALLVDAGARLRYHGDFDWPGVALANEVVTAFGARPWLLGAADYLAAPAQLPLSGPAVDPAWDAELGAAMRSRGLAVHEEAVLPELLRRW